MEEPVDLLLPDADAWRTWLAENHESADSVWLVLAKKGHTDPTAVTYEQAVEEALCFGWIDGLTKRRDDATYRQRYTRRRPRSTWSASNVARVARLEAAGRMHPSGAAEVERAKADGRWDAALGTP